MIVIRLPKFSVLDPHLLFLRVCDAQQVDESMTEADKNDAVRQGKFWFRLDSKQSGTGQPLIEKMSMDAIINGRVRANINDALYASSKGVSGLAYNNKQTKKYKFSFVY